MNNTVNRNGNNNRLPVREFVNRAIRVPKVLCIDGETGQNFGILPTHEALKMAMDKGLDLVQVSPPTGGRPPTCKIMDFGKFKYDESKKQKSIAKHRRESEIETKEIKFRPITDLNDLKTKARKAIEILDEGNSLKVTVVFRDKHEIKFSVAKASHRELAETALKDFMNLIPNSYELSPKSIDAKSVSVMVGRKDNNDHYR